MSSKGRKWPSMGRWNDDNLAVLEATSENFRIEVDQVIRNFISDQGVKEHSFPATLNNLERKYIHQKAQVHNLMSRSHGRDPERILTLLKKRTKSNFESFYINLCSQSKIELSKIKIAPESGRKLPSKKPPLRDSVFNEIASNGIPFVQTPRVAPAIKAFQDNLPIHEMKYHILEKMETKGVLIITSETGSGKTTQIPQFIMDKALSRNEPCKILCTQPRRISAVSVAERVAHERGSALGESVGYHIRLESKVGNNCNLIYCTNGILIRNIIADDNFLTSVTHIIIDEVHERDKLSDFLLICLRQCLRNGSKIKLILMSATIDAQKFKEYFEEAEIFDIPGRLFPISRLYLDDILELTDYDKVLLKRVQFNSPPSVPAPKKYPSNPQFDGMLNYCFNAVKEKNEQAAWSQLFQYIFTENMPVNYQHSETGLTALMIAVMQDNVILVEQLCNLGSDPSIVSDRGTSATLIANARGVQDIILLLSTVHIPQVITREELLSCYHKTIADDTIDFELLTKLISIIHNQYQVGAILVFLPGIDDIMTAHENIMQCETLNPSTYKVFFLHSSMNIREQHGIFDRIRLRKIILSTNIAETSVTIDDVVYVIDSGKAKVQSFDSVSGLSSLQVQWISKACAQQRSGRAGRVQSGVCFHLYSKLRYESFMNERIPEILRVPLEELCLNTKTLARNDMSIYNFLVLAPDPPPPSSVKTAIDNLEGLGALDSEENLTPLGEYLSQLAIDPHLGKMLIYGVIFKCLDPILTIISSLAQKDPFHIPSDLQLRSVASNRRKLMSMGTFSDHMIYLKAFIRWQESVKRQNEKPFCKEFFISPSTMDTILKTRTQLLCQLRSTKLVPIMNSAFADLNVNSDNWPMIKAIIAAGLYPKMAFKNSINRFCTRSEKKVGIHNTSVMARENLNLWLVYDEMVKIRNGHQIRGVTPITPITISLTCGVKAVSTIQNHLEIDEWLEFEFPNESIINLRKLLDRLIRKSLANPMYIPNESEQTAVKVMANLLIHEDRNAGMILPTGIKQKPKFVETNRTARGQHNNFQRASVNFASTSTRPPPSLSSPPPRSTYLFSYPPNETLVHPQHKQGVFYSQNNNNNNNWNNGRSRPNYYRNYTPKMTSIDTHPNNNNITN